MEGFFLPYRVPVYLWALIWFPPVYYCCAQDYDWTQTVEWKPTPTVYVETSKEGYGDYPFRNTVSLPGQVLKVSHTLGYSVVRVRLRSVSFTGDEEYSVQEREAGVSNFSGVPSDVASYDFYDISIKLPAEVAKGIERSESGESEGDDNLVFHFEKESKELRAIKFRTIERWGELRNGANSLTWITDESGNIVDESELPSSERVVISEVSPLTRAFRRNYHEGLSRNFRVNEFQFFYRCKDLEDKIWIKERDSIGLVRTDWLNYMLWYTPRGFGVYVYAGAADAGADAAGSTTMVASASASEMFAKREGGLVVFDEVREINAPNGYLVLKSASLDAEELKRIDAESSVNVRAYQEKGGGRFFVSDWSYDRIAQGEKPNYIWIRR
ncbi:MAG: hypothetical protein P1U86_05670 [Verrucomicrobiales bacterium]|nr:hypothetical protein [Verrucomicrobiales bacterium]